MGLIQVPPKLVRGRTLFARALQLAGELYGPLAAAGTGFWARGEGNYWGHNAIIRVRPFIELCGLPLLSGPAPFGGPILSHDFVEAALMRRGGWQVWIADDLGGSYEEPPPSIEDFAVRDRRWCQGNLQHIRVLFARRLHWVSRLHLGIGIMSYLTSPLWMLFLAALGHAGLGAGARPAALLHRWLALPGAPGVGERRGDPALDHHAGPAVRARSSWGCAWRSSTARGGGRSAAASGLVASALLETLYSGLVAPIMMLRHTTFVTSILLGGVIEWKPQRREAGASRVDLAVRTFLWPTLIGVGAALGTWIVTPHLFVWLLPVMAGLVLAVPLALAGASTALGDRLRRHSLLMIAEEALPPAVIGQLDSDPAAVPAAGADPLVRAVLEPQANALHLQLLRAYGDPHERTVVKDRWLVERKAVFLGPSSLDKAERRVILEDPEVMERLHLQAWVQWPSYLPGILGALGPDGPSASPEVPGEASGKQSAGGLSPALRALRRGPHPWCAVRVHRHPPCAA